MWFVTQIKQAEEELNELHSFEQTNNKQLTTYREDMQHIQHKLLTIIHPHTDTNTDIDNDNDNNNNSKTIAILQQGLFPFWQQLLDKMGALVPPNSFPTEVEQQLGRDDDARSSIESATTLIDTALVLADLTVNFRQKLTPSGGIGSGDQELGAWCHLVDTIHMRELLQAAHSMITSHVHGFFDKFSRIVLPELLKFSPAPHTR